MKRATKQPTKAKRPGKSSAAGKPPGTAAAFVLSRVKTAKRLVNNALHVRTAAEAIGPIKRGCEIYALSTGQFSLVDVICHVLEATGPAHVTLSTWTAAAADMEIAFRLLTDGGILSMRFIVDFSFPVRQPAYCAALRERFGDEAVRVTKNHAKFVLIRNARWNITIRTSMNLNENRRLESLEISDDKGLAKFLDEVCTKIFAAEPAGKSFTNRPIENIEHFGKTFGVQRDGRSTDERKFFGDGPVDNDLRRAGITWD